MGITEDKVYQVGVFILLLTEIFLAIPLMVDSSLHEGSNIIALVAMGHFFWLLFGKTGLVERALTLAHIFGIMGLFISMIPVVSFIWHGLVAWLLVKYIIQTSKDYRKNQ